MKKVLSLSAVLGIFLIVALAPARAIPIGEVHANKVVVEVSAGDLTKMCLAGSFSTLPTSGYAEGCLAYQTSNKTVYVSTQTVVSALSWKAL